MTLLHPPYTAWHLSYVCLGWAASPGAHADRLVALLGAFFLAVGIGAHALDELNGHPLGTAISNRTLASLAAASVAPAAAIGIAGAARVSWSIVAFVAFGVFIVPAYNLELFGGAFHNDVWFALAWGAFPALTAGWANHPQPSLAVALTAAACFALSVAQRTLSTPVRTLRRRVRTVSGTIETATGGTIPITAATLRAPAEGALRALSLAMALLAAAAVAARIQG